jgi:PST family polysaccharide transporter
MGYIQTAKGKNLLFFCTQLFAHTLHLTLIWFGVTHFGLPGTGMAFFGFCSVQWFVIFYVARRLSGFRWSVANRQLGLMIIPVVTAVFLAPYFVPPVWVMALGVTVTLSVGLYSLKRLYAIVGAPGVSALLAKIKPF